MAGMMLKRSFSLSAVAQTIVKLPCQVHGIEGRYASALYTAGIKSKRLDVIDKDFHELKRILDQSAKFKEFVRNPTLRPLVKKKGVLAVLEKVNVCKECENFLILLAENGRLNKFEAMVNSFESVMRAHRGEIFVEITSAEPLSKKHEAALNEALKGFLKPNQTVHVKMSVNPSIIGGLILNIGDKYIDLSMASRIKKFEEALLVSI